MTYISIAETLRQAVKESDTSLNDLEEATGVNHSALSRFMRGRRSLSLPAVEKLCEYFGLQIMRPKAAAQPKKGRARP